MATEPPFKITPIDYPEEVFELLSPFWKGDEDFFTKLAFLEYILDLLGYTLEDINREIDKKVAQGVTPKEFISSLKKELEIED